MFGKMVYEQAAKKKPTLLSALKLFQICKLDEVFLKRQRFSEGALLIG